MTVVKGRRKGCRVEDAAAAGKDVIKAVGIKRVEAAAAADKKLDQTPAMK